jgi:ABC-type transport system involved in cytochrome bd biosynthesis fused ATPase/permease subunit
VSAGPCDEHDEEARQQHLGRVERRLRRGDAHAVDAHTEARIARQLHHFRAGATTVVVSTSPLVLDQADTVVLIGDGVVQAAGKHRELLRTHPAYKDVVTRGEAA